MRINLLLVAALLVATLALHVSTTSAQTSATTCSDNTLMTHLTNDMNGLIDNFKKAPQMGAGTLWAWTVQIAGERQVIEDMNMSSDAACAALQLTAIVTLSNINDYATLVMADKLALVTDHDAYNKSLDAQTARVNKYVDMMNALMGATATATQSS